MNASRFGLGPERSLPSGGGPPTFVFTDIEGSTLRWELHPAEMRVALERHDALVQALLDASGGLVFNTIGDAFCAVFRSPLAAARAAIAVHRALAAEDFSAVGGLRVRIALHTGYAEERGGDFFGASVNRVARLLAAGHGNQIVTEIEYRAGDAESAVRTIARALAVERETREASEWLGEHAYHAARREGTTLDLVAAIDSLEGE